MTADILKQLEEGSRFAVKDWAARSPADRLVAFFGEPHKTAPIVYMEGRIRRGISADVLSILRALKEPGDE